MERGCGGEARSRRSRETRLLWSVVSAERPERKRRAGGGAVPKENSGPGRVGTNGRCLRTCRRLQHQSDAFGLCPRTDKVTLRWSLARPNARRRKPQGKGRWAGDTAGKSGRDRLGWRGTRLPKGQCPDLTRVKSGKKRRNIKCLLLRQSVWILQSCVRPDDTPRNPAAGRRIILPDARG